MSVYQFDQLCIDFCMNERRAVEITFFVFIRIIRSFGILSYICISEKDSL